MQPIQKSNERKYYLDWLRVIAFYLLIFYHCGMIFVPWDFHIKNDITLEWFETWMAFMNQWRLPLLFMISGMVIFYSMGKRSALEIIKERNTRLLIPLLFGMLVIIPPQIYYERISDGIQFASYFDFWKTVFNFVPFPEGGSLSWHHLWYVLYILVYSTIALPMFIYLKSRKSLYIRERINNFFYKNPYAIYLFIFPLLLNYYLLAPIFPTTHALIDDWYNHSISFSIFLLGFCISAFDGLRETIFKMKNTSLVSALIPSSFLVLFVWGPTFELFNEDSVSFFVLYGILKWLFIVSWLYTILGYGSIILNKSSKFLSYANESVYPLYILHQTIMIIFGYYIIHLDWNVYLKFGVILIITFGGSLLIYELLVKRNYIFRILFGMKARLKKEKDYKIKIVET